MLHEALGLNTKARTRDHSGPSGPRGLMRQATGAVDSKDSVAQLLRLVSPLRPRQAPGLYRRVQGTTLMALHGQLYSIKRLVLKLLLATHTVTCPLLLRHRTE